MSLLTNHPHFSYQATNNSVAYPSGGTPTTKRGAKLQSGGSAHTYGSWTQITSGYSAIVEHVTIQIAGTRTGGNIIAAQTLNAYVDIGVGPNSSSVSLIAEKLSGSNASGPGIIYNLPLRIPADTPVWARHQNTAALANCGIVLSVMGGNMNPGTWPNISNVRAFGATTASTTGTAITPGASGAEGGWTEIIASTDKAYRGVMVSPLFVVDTTMTVNLLNTIDIAIGPNGSEVLIGENVTTSFIFSANEEVTALCTPILYSIPAGTRIAVRCSGSTAADTSSSVIVYMLDG